MGFSRILSPRPLAWVLSKTSPLRGFSSSVNRPVHKEYAPSKSEKFYLVWTGKYKSVDQVPQFVALETIDRAKSNVRVKVCNYMIVLTALACFAYAMIGKRKAERGETVQQMNLDWHKEINSQFDKEQAVKAPK